MSSLTGATIGLLLDELEAREDRLLAWGIVDGGFTRSEVETLVEDILLEEDPLLEPIDAVNELLATGLLHDAGEGVLRTRSAETIRLMLRLRQLFPGRSGTGAWAGAPTLVSDYRYLRRPRMYARRDRPKQDVIAALELTVSQRRALDALMPERLAGFQERATHGILDDLRQSHPTGTVVGAGTGSGKTWAFYLPALAALADLHSPQHWTRALAVYPRTELLKDQLQTAFENAALLNDLLIEIGGRPLRIGALYGATKHEARNVGEKGGWEARDGGRLIPYLVCRARTTSGEACHGGLVWPDEHRSANPPRELLRCTRCRTEVSGEHFALTRRSIMAEPPDLLFLTGEMLNRALANRYTGRVVGIGAKDRPRLLLLDEIHTYGGTSGAQTAMLLRRWQHRVQRPVAFVGLSATLVDAQDFFATLTGVPEERVRYVTPSEDELVAADAEHLLALRSDPVSGGSTLSTTIQATMLLPRVLDPHDPGRDLAESPSRGRYGSRTFVFTDDLDVNNRLYFDVLDAEGQRVRNRRSVEVKPTLASLRSSLQVDDMVPARRAGQVWDLAERIGHSLDPDGRLIVDRTSSQDSGVRSDASVVVATASLEVGFDDPRVGAVVQHKAPRDVASFLQRKGRAGRPQGMRPWTVVVLSDYGRDRDVYEGWDALLDPTLPPRSLPVHNRQVLRMHAAQCLIDWLSIRVDHRSVNLWWQLGGSGIPGDQAKEVRGKVAELLRQLLQDPSLQASLRDFTRKSLMLDERTVDELLWQPPRSVMLEAAPTLLRRIELSWETIDPSTGQGAPDTDLAGHGIGSPLPDFFTSALFGDLALPELMVHVPTQGRDSDGTTNPMPVVQGLTSFAPGRVQKRFATADSGVRHWWPLPGEGPIVVDEVMDHRPDGQVHVAAEGRSVPMLRPIALRVSADVPHRVADSSNAFLEWTSQLEPTGDPLTIALPQDDPFGKILRQAAFHLHATLSHVEARRAAHRVYAEVSFRDGTEQRTQHAFVDKDGHEVAVGATYGVDGMRFEVELPEPDLEEDALRLLRAPWFIHRMTTDEQLLRHGNMFRLGWLAQALLVTLIAEATERGGTLSDTYAQIRPQIGRRLVESVDLLFGIVTDAEDVEAADEEQDDDAAAAQDLLLSGAPSRLRRRIVNIIEFDGFLDDVDRVIPALWCDGSEADLRAWVRARRLATIGSGVLEAVRRACPEHDPESLILDLEPLAPDGRTQTGAIWITEQAVGGGGAIEALAQAVRRQPRRFLRLVDHAVTAGTDDELDRDLGRFLTMRDDPRLAPAVARYRASMGNADRLDALAELRQSLVEVGLPAGRRLLAPLTARLLRPGSSTAQDAVTSRTLEGWRAAEAQLGCEIDLRTWATLAARDPSYDVLLPTSTTLAGLLPQLRFDAISSILWPRGWRVRGRHLRSYNPWATHPAPAPELVREILEDTTPSVSALTPGAASAVRSVLASRGSCDLRAPNDERAALTDVLMQLLVEPIESEFLQVHPVAVAASVRHGDVTVRLEVRQR